jgi:hypothetical protein
MTVVTRKKNKNISSFDTQDFGQAVALLAKGHELIAMHPLENSKRVVFHFVITPVIEQDAQDYWNGKLLVDAKRYWGESKSLKTRLYGVHTS